MLFYGSSLKYFLVLAILTGCPPTLIPRNISSAEDFQPFYYSTMEPGGLSTISTDSKIRFKGTHDENPNNVYFLIEPHTAFIKRQNQTAVVMFAGGLENESCANGGVNPIDCHFRSTLIAEQKAQEACENSLLDTGLYSPELFVSKFPTFANNFARIQLGSVSNESLFVIPSFFSGNRQRYTHALFIQDLQKFCASPRNNGVPDCVNFEGLPSSSCYFVAELPLIPTILEETDSF